MMSDAHQRPLSGGQRELRLALSLTVAMMVIELLAGWMSGSLALLADAVHMLTDASGLTLSLFAAWFATRPANLQKTYGYYRTEILAALANGVGLWLMVIWIFVRAFQRLQHPQMVPSGPMMFVACLGLAVNLLSGWILHTARARSLNLQGAWLNVMSDALGSIGVIVAGCAIRWVGWMAADPIASMMIGVLIAINSWNLVKQAVNILLEATPRHLQIPEITQAMRAIPGIQEIHDVHLWTITTGMEAMSGHAIVEDMKDSATILSGLSALLANRFGISHTTFQLEPRTHHCHMGTGQALPNGG